MSGVETRIKAFVKLGSFFREFVTSTTSNAFETESSDPWIDKFSKVIVDAGLRNGWFTKEQVLHAIGSWGYLLEEASIKDWISSYNMEVQKSKTIAIITAGNIPLVGFHDLICTLICGHNAIVKCSSNDQLLLPFIADYLTEVEPGFKDKVQFTEGRLTEYDAVIATGSNNTARYFEYYFGKKPNIIRRNRNSVAVLSGDESREDLEQLGEDIFRYYGLGCRSVSKLFVPKDYDFEPLFQALFKYQDVLQQQKYANNYDYNKAVYLMSEFIILDNGFLMLKEDLNYASPIATLFYEYYDTADDIKAKLQEDSEQIQCVVADGFTETEISFGRTQQPGLADYADGIDTVEFLLRI